MTNTNNDRVPIPRKLNNGMIGALSEYIRKGNYAVVACRLCNLAESTFYDWISRGESDIDAGRESLYRNLVESLKNAEAEAEAEMVNVARNASVEKKDGYLAITVNERRHPDRWGRRERRTIDVTEHKTIEITHVETIKDYGPEGVIETEEYKLLDNKTT